MLLCIVNECRTSKITTKMGIAYNATQEEFNEQVQTVMMWD